MNQKLKDWLELIRFPNLFTLPGDILVGAATSLAFSQFYWGRFGFLCLISALLYAGGLVLNDCMDYDEDKRERPDRVLPSGRIKLTHAYAMVVFCFSVALALAWFLSLSSFVVCLLLIGAIYAYDGPARKIPKLGFLVMGLCRGLNILLGATIASGLDFASFAAYLPISLAFACETAYIYCVCVIAHTETSHLPSKFWCRFPLNLVIGICSSLLVLGLWSKSFSWFGLAAAVYLIYSTRKLTDGLNETLPVNKIPPYIGKLIRNLIPLQFCLVLCIDGNGYWLPAIIFALALPVSAGLAKKWSMS